MQGAIRFPLLTGHQELMLAFQVQDWLRDPAPSKSCEIIGRRARDKLVCSNLRLVAAFALKLRTRVEIAASIDMGDVLQEGAMGLATAVEKFDPTAGYKFSTYAYWWIRQRCSDCCLRNSSPIRPSAGAMAIWNRFKASGQSLNEFAETEGTNPERVKRMIDDAHRALSVSSLDVRLTSDSDEHLDRIAAVADPRSVFDDQRIHLEGLVNDLRSIAPLAVGVYERREFCGMARGEALASLDKTLSEFNRSIAGLRKDLGGLLERELREALAV